MNLLCPYKRLFSILCFIVMSMGTCTYDVGHLQCWYVVYKDRSRVAKLYDNKLCQILWRLNTSTYIRNILVVCVIWYSLHRVFTGNTSHNIHIVDNTLIMKCFILICSFESLRMRCINTGVHRVCQIKFTL